MINERTPEDSIDLYLANLENEKQIVQRILQTVTTPSQSIELTYAISDLSKKISSIDKVHVDNANYLISVDSGSKNVDSLSAFLKSTFLKNALEKSEKIFSNDLNGIPVDIQYNVSIVLPKTAFLEEIVIPISPKVVSNYLNSIHS